MYVCMHGCMYVCMHGCMYVCMHGCMDAWMYVCIAGLITTNWNARCELIPMRGAPIEWIEYTAPGFRFGGNKWISIELIEHVMLYILCTFSYFWTCKRGPELTTHSLVLASVLMDFPLRKPRGFPVSTTDLVFEPHDWKLCWSRGSSSAAPLETQILVICRWRHQGS